MIETEAPPTIKWMVIRNVGEVDVEGMRLLGASTKRTDPAKIGYFGTGWKYAMAALLKRGINIRVFSGTTEVSISKKPITVRGEIFEEIILGGSPTSVTTHVGPKWESWMAVREMLTNAIDEGDWSFDEGVIREPKGEAGFTGVWIEKVADLPYPSDQRYFRLQPDCIERTGLGRILLKLNPDEPCRVYRKGILVHVSDRPSLFDYDLETLDISEERLASASDCKRGIWKLLGACSKELKIQVLTQMKGYEVGIADHWVAANESWAEALDGYVVLTRQDAQYYQEELRDRKTIQLPDEWVATFRDLSSILTVANVLKKKEKAKSMKERVVKAEAEDVALAIRFLNALGVSIPMADVLIVDEFQEKSKRGGYNSEDRKYYLKSGLEFRERIEILFREHCIKTANETGIRDTDYMAQVATAIFFRNR